LTVFDKYLWTFAAILAATASALQSALEAEAAVAALSPLRILIAEDNLVNQKVILKVMQKVLPESRPTVVNNGLEAVEVSWTGGQHRNALTT
jgi:hypothetical protein